MISNQILQNTIEGLKAITRIDLGVMDTDGKTLATTFTEPGDYGNAVLSFVESPAESQVIQGFQFFKIYDEHQLEYILIANGGSEDVYMVGKIAAFQIQNLPVGIYLRTCFIRYDNALLFFFLLSPLHSVKFVKKHYKISL